ncbi:hypothetical protein HELRODRAFT_181273 [Helobdella robusta]|uniref:Uncharacterized protein n=1 Tax=Helobdella robusta TaxID=6412 RepID=T1FGU0_HELRO|nr:hypothetical protein HELRODRAFT_181273 [Helobdella robusta]ESN93164.1 hypothetical protein HELRODRAFT_181273 [Helobdella robusta]
MVKDYFVDGLFLFMFVLSIQNIKWEPQTDLDVIILGGADWQFRRAGGGNLEDGQQIISTITSGTNNRGLWNFESQVHLKSVADQSEVEDVIRKIHLLGQYNNRFSHRTFGTEISAFLLNESLPLANINIATGALVYGSNEQNISQQSGPNGAEPTKDDLELIDVLWGQDVDLEKTLELTELDQSSRYKLEREMELLLHEKQEEETLEQLVQQEFLDNYFGPSFLSPLNEPTNHFAQEIFQSNLNTPEVILDEHESDNVFFSSHVNSSHQQESLERYHAATTSDVTTSDFTASDFTTSDITAYVLDCDQLNSANYSSGVSVNWSAGCDANEDVSNNILLQNVSLANYPSISFLQGGEWMSHEQLNNSVSTPFTDISGQQHALPIFQLFNNSHASLSSNNTLTEDNLFGLDEIYEFSHDNDLTACKSKDEHENEVHAEEWGSLRREGDDIFCINFNTDSACAVKSDDLSDCSSCESELDVVMENDKFGDIDSFIMGLIEEQSATPERKKVHLDSGRRIRLFDQLFKGKTVFNAALTDYKKFAYLWFMRVFLTNICLRV